MLILVPFDKIEDNPFQTQRDYLDVPDLALRIEAAIPAYESTRGLMQVPHGRIVYPNGEAVKIVNLDTLEFAWENGNHLTKLPDDAQVQLAIGHRRLRACELLDQGGIAPFGDGLMPLYIHNLSDDQMLNSAWAENAERKDISDVEKAQLLKAKWDRAVANGGSQRDVAEAWGINRSTVASLIGLLDLPEDVQEANRDGRLSARQCQAIRSIIKVKTAVSTTGASPEWNEREVGNIYAHQAPAAPQAMIAHILANPDTDSESIRKYAKDAAGFAGNTLPDGIARHKVAGNPSVRQPLCAGCPARINATCMDVDCLAEKKQLFINSVVTAVADEYGMTITDDTESQPFLEASNGLDCRRAVTSLFEYGKYQNLLVAWTDNNKNHCRPFAELGFIYPPSAAFENNGRSGIVIAYNGTEEAAIAEASALRAEESANSAGEASGSVPETAVITEDIATPEQIKEWKAAAIAYVKRAKEIIAERLFEEFSAVNTDVLQALLFSPASPRIDDQEKITGELVQWIFNKQQHKWSGKNYFYTRIDEWNALVKFSDRSGIGQPALWKSVEDDNKKQAILALDFWYTRRSDTWNKDAPAEAKEYLENAIYNYDGFADTAKIAEELDRAANDVDARIKADQQKQAEIEAQNNQ